jgi:hypothetical protein
MAEEILRLQPDKVKALIKQGKMGIVQAPSVERSSTSSDLVEFSRKLFEQDFLGPEIVEKTFGLSLSPGEIPPIQFTHQELDEAHRNDEILILRVPRTPDRSPLTMQKMQEILQPAFDATGNGKVLFPLDWYKNEDFFTQDRPRLGWALVAKKPVDTSKSKNFLEQSEILADYLKAVAYRNTNVPSNFAEAISELGRERQAIAGILGSDQKGASAKLVDLKINQLTRQTATETMYDLMMYFQNNGERLLPNIYTWTNTRTSDGSLVMVGRFDSNGVHVRSYWPDYSDPRVGVCPSR